MCTALDMWYVTRMNFGRAMSVSSGRSSRLMILVSSAGAPVRRHYARPPWSRIVLLIYAKVCPPARALAPRLPPFPTFALPPFLFLFLLLFARRALNYGGNATKSSRLIELLLESRRGVRLTKKEREKRAKKNEVPPPCAFLPLHTRLCPSLAGMISCRREFPGNNFECVRLGLSISRRRWARIRGSNRL